MVMDNLDEKYKSKNPFTVPDRYFDTLGDRVMDRIKDEEGVIRFCNDRRPVADP